MLKAKLALASLLSLPKGIENSYLRHTTTLITLAIDKNTCRTPNCSGKNSRAINGADTKIIICAAILLDNSFTTLMTNELFDAFSLAIMSLPIGYLSTVLPNKELRHSSEH
jgi:hypothetical protein